jgi:hypothetical protein
VQGHVDLQAAWRQRQGRNVLSSKWPFVMHKLIVPGKPRHAKNHCCIGMQVAALRTRNWDASTISRCPGLYGGGAVVHGLPANGDRARHVTVLIAGV